MERPIRETIHSPGATSLWKRWLYVLLVATLLWRIIRYSMQWPVWGDESRLMLNLVFRDHYADLLRPLDHLQVAPLGWLAAQFAVIKSMGTSELALRLLPLLTGIIAILAFARLVWVVLPPLTAVLAFGLLSSAGYVTRYSLDIKPYGTDLMAASVLLLLAVRWMQSPQRWRWLLCLLLFVPLAVFLSFPSVFVGGAICSGMLPVVHAGVGGRERLRRLAAPALLGITLLASFIAMMALSGDGQYTTTRDGMRYHWEEGMPPTGPWACLKWLVVVHTSEMFAYPFGGKNFASTGTFALSILGGWLLWKQGKEGQEDRRPLMVTILAAFGLTMIAAILGRYPYGGSARIAQHLAPGIAIMAGTAIAWLIHRYAKADPLKVAQGVCIGLLVLTVGGIAVHVWRPYRTIDDKKIEVFFKTDRWTQRPDDVGIWLATAGKQQIPTQTLWYLYQSQGWDRAKIVTGRPDPAVLASRREWWVLMYDSSDASRATVGEAFAPLATAYQPAGSEYIDLLGKGHRWQVQKWRMQ